MKHLRFLMSDGRVTSGAARRKFARGDKVFVNGQIQREGVVIRVRDSQYTVRLDDGCRCYVLAEDLKDIEERRVMRIRRAAS
jgi:hypothetical protein